MSLQGTLRTLGIAEVLEFLAGRHATGRLEITADTGFATYWVSGGEIASVDYSFAREAGTDAAEATYYALAEVEGHFHFDEDQRPEATDDTESISDVLARTADAADGWSYVEEVIPGQQHWLSRSETIEHAVEVQPEWWVAIAAVGVGITPQNLAQALDLRALASSTMASDMVRAGLLEVSEIPVSKPTEDETTEASSMTEDGHPDALNLFGGGAPAQESGDADASAELDQVVAELESHAPVDDGTEDSEPAAHLSVVEPMDELHEESSESDDSEAALDSDLIDDNPVSPALVWDAEVAPDPAEFAEVPAMQDFDEAPIAPAYDEAPIAPAYDEAPIAPAYDEAPVMSDLGETPTIPDLGAPVAAVEMEPPSAPVSEVDDKIDSDGDDDEGWATDHSQPAAVSVAAADEYETAPAAADVFGSAPAVETSTMAPPHEELDGADLGGAADEYATDDRSSVLKFLRRD